MVMSGTVDDHIIASTQEKMNVEEYIMTRLKEGIQLNLCGEED